jgi:hypothetical protein
MNNKFLIHTEAGRDSKAVDWGISDESTNLERLPEPATIYGTPEPLHAS